MWGKSRTANRSARVEIEGGGTVGEKGCAVWMRWLTARPGLFVQGFHVFFQGHEYFRGDRGRIAIDCKEIGRRCSGEGESESCRCGWWKREMEAVEIRSK